MERSNQKARVRKIRRSLRTRNKVRGTQEKPRMCVVKTNSHIQVQLIDDEKGVTLASANTNSKEFQGTPYAKKNVESAKKLGESIANKAKAQGVSKIVFDRGSAKYHGILASLANAAREVGLQF